MKLTYRGISYEYTPPTVETSNGAPAGKYRGLDWRFRLLKNPPILQPRVNLTYRGVIYNNQPAIGQANAERKTAISIQDRARNLMMKHQKNIKNRQQSLLSRAADEIDSSEAAHHYGT